MKFVHIADLHLDSSFTNLSEKEILGNKRRLYQRKILKKVIEYIKENDIKYLFISGDLYEHQYIRRATIEYINNLFNEIPKTEIYIAPGNHDPNIKNSYYNKYEWNKNVKIFSDKIEKIETNDAIIYGYGFSDFYCINSGIEEIQTKEEEKTKILVMHATLDGANIEEKQYNSINSKKLKEKGFDYIALGHIHKTNYDNENKMIYPGSLVALGFDEVGEHGMIVGTADGKNVETKFIPLDEEKFVKKEIYITDIQSKEELIEKINSLNIEENELAEIVLIGKRKFVINKYDILKYLENDRIIKIKDKTEIAYNLEKIKNETSLKGLFVKEILKKYNSENITTEEKEIIEKAIEIGFDVLE